MVYESVLNLPRAKHVVHLAPSGFLATVREFIFRSSEEATSKSSSRSRRNANRFKSDLQRLLRLQGAAESRAQTKRWVFVTQQVDVGGHSERPAGHAHSEIEQPPRVALSEQDSEPGDDHGHDGSDIQ